MKKLLFFAAILCSLLSVQTVMAQNPITTLEHAGATSVFYGQNSLVDAYNASVNGDYLYLSTGFFTAPAAIAKGVKIIGAGHFPDSLNVVKRTTILSGLTINAGADSLFLEGLYINGDINYQSDASINYVKVIRCRLGYASFQSSSATASKNYCSYEECFIDGTLTFSNFGVNLMICHSIISNCVNSINGNALIDGNIFLFAGSPTFSSITGSVIRNNIFISAYNAFDSYCNANTLTNNLFVNNVTNAGSNSFSNNYTGITQSNIFVNQSGNAIDYTQDYHLKNHTTYLGTDGTQVGLYGGTAPFKDKGLPSNPQIISKSIGTQTDANGNLQINFSVKAQDR